MISKSLKKALDRVISPVRSLGNWIAKGEQKAPLCST
jgi:hypothetical protein